MSNKNQANKSSNKLEKLRQKAIWLASILEVVTLVIAVLGWEYDTNNDVCNQTNPYMVPLVLAALGSVLLVFWNVKLDNKSTSNRLKWVIFILFLIIGIVSIVGVAFNGHVLCNLTF